LVNRINTLALAEKQGGEVAEKAEKQNKIQSDQYDTGGEAGGEGHLFP